VYGGGFGSDEGGLSGSGGGFGGDYNDDFGGYDSCDGGFFGDDGAGA